MKVLPITDITEELKNDIAIAQYARTQTIEECMQVVKSIDL